VNGLEFIERFTRHIKTPMLHQTNIFRYNFHHFARFSIILDIKI